MSGYFGIGIENPKFSENIGTLLRSAHCFGASFIFSIGRIPKCPMNTLKTERHIPVYNYDSYDSFFETKPKECKVIGVEITSEATDIRNFKHPKSAVYIMGPENGNLSILEECHDIIYIPTFHCLNVSIAGSIVMYDRILKRRGHYEHTRV